MVALALSFVSVTAAAQGKTVSGVVSDDQGPLIGVSVIQEGTTNGTVTDHAGRYSLTLGEGSQSIVFSSIGYKTVTITPSSSSADIVMEIEAQLLDDVMVIGYGTQSKSHLTGSISKVGGEGLVDVPVSDVTTALQGQIAGLTVNNVTSEVGVAPALRVRGTGSISADSSPLVIVDGYPIAGGLSMVNASDVKSIEVLKDAASAAIYGSRAANGVIMITTKSGVENKPSYSVKIYEGVKMAYKLHDVMTATEYLDLMKYEEAEGGIAVKAQDRAAAWVESNMGATDWQREALRNFADIKSAQFSVSGGKKGVRYYTSASITQDKGLMIMNEALRFSLRSKMDVDLSPKTKFGYNISFNYSKTSRPYNNFTDYYRTPSFLPVKHNDWSTALTGYSGYARGSHFNSISAPTGAPDEFGNPAWETGSPFSSANNNPKSIVANAERWSESYQGVANLYFQWEIVKGLTFKTSDGFNVKYAPSYYYAKYGAIKDSSPSEATFFSTMTTNFLSENTLNYKLDKGKHKLDALLGYTLEGTNVFRVAMTATGFPTDDVHTLNAATIFQIASSNNGNGTGTGTFKYPRNILESGLARVSYSYDDKYLISASVRLDRSSLFSKGHRNAWFPSVSVGWRLSEEPWLKNVWWVNQLKLRASYGVTGNNNVAYSSSMELFNAANYVTGSGNGSLTSGAANVSSTLANSDITWEQTDEFNVGLDMSVLKSRITLSVDAYYSTTRALLFEQPTQSFTGFNYFWNNIGRVRNAGAEFQLDTYNIDRKNFKWETSVNLSFNRSRLLEIAGESQLVNQGERSEGYISRVGQSVVQFYGYKTDGVWLSQADIDANPHFSSDVPGGLKIVDTNKDGVLDENDRTVLGNPEPSVTYGMTNRFGMGRFDLSILIQGVAGVTVYNGDVYYNETHKYNKAYTANRWVSETHPGDGKTPYGKNGYDLCLTDYPLQNASYVCLRNVTLGYTLSKKDLKNKLGGLRFYLTGANLAYIWSKNYKGINPEARVTSGAYSSPLITGYQRGGFPLTSTVTFGIDLKF
ncbi:MAG: TonB-dependent receptor [Bacteroidales bacterium]|nr:TonB-dependent receptor [Bacteroidales bacterium]